MSEQTHLLAGESSSLRSAEEVADVASMKPASNKEEPELGPEDLQLLRRFFLLLDGWDQQQGH